MRLEPARDRPPRRAPAARQRGHLGHQRQDDDGRDGRRRSSSAPARASSHNRAGANMAGGVATALLSRAPRGDGDTGLFEVDEFWLGQVVRRAAPARAAAGQPLPRPARPLRRARDDRRPLGRSWRPSTPARARAQRRRPARRRPRPRPRRRRCTSASRTTRGAAGDAARRRRQALPALRRALRLRRRLPRPPRPLPLRQLRRDAARSRRSPPATSCSRACAARASRCARRRASAAIALPLPGLYNVYNALGAAALALALGASLDDVVAGLEAVSPAFGRAETVRIGGRELSILLVKNPAGANEVLRTLALEPGEHDVLAVLNDNIADGRDVSWVWDADFEVLAAARAPRDVRGTRAAEMALRLKYAGVARRPHRRRARARRRASTARCATATAGSSRCRPTRRCSRCATCSSTRGAAGGRSR